MDISCSNFLLDSQEPEAFMQNTNLDSELQQKLLKDQLKRSNQTINQLEQKNLVQEKTITLLIKNVNLLQELNKKPILQNLIKEKKSIEKSNVNSSLTLDYLESINKLIAKLSIDSAKQNKMDFNKQRPSLQNKIPIQDIKRNSIRNEQLAKQKIGLIEQLQTIQSSDSNNHSYMEESLVKENFKVINSNNDILLSTQNIGLVKVKDNLDQEETLNLNNLQESNLLLKSINDSSFCQNVNIVKKLIQEFNQDDQQIKKDENNNNFLKKKDNNQNDTWMKFSKNWNNNIQELPRHNSLIGQGQKLFKTFEQNNNLVYQKQENKQTNNIYLNLDQKKRTSKINSNNGKQMQVNNTDEKNKLVYAEQLNNKTSNKNQLKQKSYNFLGKEKTSFKNQQYYQILQ